MVFTVEYHDTYMTFAVDTYCTSGSRKIPLLDRVHEDTRSRPLCYAIFCGVWRIRDVSVAMHGVLVAQVRRSINLAFYKKARALDLSNVDPDR